MGEQQIPMKLRFPMPQEALDAARLMDCEFLQFGPSSWVLVDKLTQWRFPVYEDVMQQEPHWRAALIHAIQARNRQNSI
jgi:hypothetical protein